MRLAGVDADLLMADDVRRMVPLLDFNNARFPIKGGLLQRRGGTVTLRGAGEQIPVGIVRDHVFENRVFEVATGDVLVLHTDGIVEARDATGEPFGPARLPKRMAGKVFFSERLSKLLITITSSMLTLSPFFTGARPTAAQVSPSEVFRRR